MIYQAKVREIKYIQDYEGMLVIECNGITTGAYYQAPQSFAHSNFVNGKVLSVDLWHVYGHATTRSERKQEFPTDIKIAGGTIKGCITKIHSKQEFRVNCGDLEIDVHNEEQIEVKENDNIETTGTYQIFFPNTEHSKEEYF